MENPISNGPECHDNRIQPHTQDYRNDQKLAANLYFRNINLDRVEDEVEAKNIVNKKTVRSKPVPELEQ